MAVYEAFDMEDDDFFDDDFVSFSEAELSTIQGASTSSEALCHENSSQTSEKKSSEILSALDIQFSNSHETDVKSSVSNSITSTPNVFEKDEGFEIQKNPSPNLNPNMDETSMIDSRFIPGFTPKAKKREFPGPVNLFFLKEEDPFNCHKFHHQYKKNDDADIDIKDIINSQCSEVDDLHLPSWQSLQADVSSSHNLSVAKYYSIQRIFRETSQKKLPKHIVVPVLCVLLKKFNHMESPSEFIDDTGKITGKFDKEVLELYKAYLKDGISLTLIKVTCMCNILLLTKQSLATIYLEDGTVKRIQEVDSISNKETPLKPMACKCPETTSKTMRSNCIPEKSSVSPAVSRNYVYKHQNCANSSNSNMKVSYSKENASNFIKQRTSNSNPSKFSDSDKQMTSKSGPNVSDIEQNRVPLKYLDVSSPFKGKNSTQITNNLRSTSNNISNCNKKLKKTMCENSIFSVPDLRHSTPNHLEKHCPSAKITDTFSEVETFEGNNFFEENTEMDDFDELLGSLDEESFLEEI